MSDPLRIDSINSVRVDNIKRVSRNLDDYSLSHILANPEISDDTKMKYLSKHRTQVNRIIKNYFGSEEYNIIMAQRPLLNYKPIKNAFTKHGDKVLLAEAIGVDPKHINYAITQHLDSLKSTGDIAALTDDQKKSLQKYIYRHGSQDQVVTFFDYELSNSFNIKGTLAKNLTYTKGGIADYFSRPIHRMKNETLVKLSNIVTAKIEEQKTAGTLKEAEAAAMSDQALKLLCILQYNSKLPNALKKSLS